jgi:PAS domain S-box-containing protein
LTGRPAEAFLGDGSITLESLLAPDDAQAIARIDADLQAGRRADRDFRIVHADGSIRWLNLRGEPERGPDGSIIVHGVMLDVTARKEAETALHLRERAIERLAQGVVITDGTRPDTPIVYVNRAFEELTGYSADEMLGRNASFLDGAETDPQTIAGIKHALATAEPFDGELVTYRKDGSSFWSAVRISPVVDESGSVTHFISIHTDETPRKQLDQQVLQAQKLEAVGRLAGGVAHDFNNVLLVVRGYSHVLMSMLGESAPGWSEAKEIELAADRASQLVRQLLTFSRNQVVRTTACDLNSIVVGAQPLLEPVIGGDIELRTELDPDLRGVTAVPTQIEEALVNLLVNARDAMPHGGTLVIGTANVDIDEDSRVQLPPGRYATLSVRDTGLGMDAATRARIFEPFFSTKTATNGTGLGLSMVYGAVKQCGGEVNVVTAPGEGTTVTIFLPARVETASVDSKPRAPIVSCKETVLLVEDNGTALKLVGRLLREEGYDVLEADLPEQALRLCDEHQGRIELLLSDVVMPQMSGPTLAKHILERRPGTRVIFVSGYIHHPDDVDIVVSGDAFLQKPFTPGELLQAVRRVLDVEHGVAA